MSWSNLSVAGLLPEILRVDDPRSVQEQLDDRYSHGGGCYKSTSKWELDDKTHLLLCVTYAEEFYPLSRCQFPLSDEFAVLHESAFLSVGEISTGKLKYVTRVD